jgi:AcrR family transcriptional regulator
MSTQPYGIVHEAVKRRPGPAEGRHLRVDTARTRQRLLEAAGMLLAGEAPFSLSDLARAAGVSTATAYRHFDSVDEVAFTFVASFIDHIEERSKSVRPSSDPAQHLYRLCRIWVDAVLAWGPALTYLRSPEGFLARRRRGEAEVTRSLRYIEPALHAVLPVDASPDDLAYAVAVWNALADPREVLDQRTVLGWSPAGIARRLHGTVLAVVR